MIETNNIVFVDSRGTFRSVVAHSFALHYAERSGLKGILNFESCGISAINGLPVSPEAKKVTLELNVPLAKNYALSIFDVSLEIFDFIVVFEEWHAVRVKKLLEDEIGNEQKILKLGTFFNYGSSLPVKPGDSGPSKKEVGLSKDFSDIISPISNSYEDYFERAQKIKIATRNLIYYLSNWRNL